VAVVKWRDVPRGPLDGFEWVRFWDLAATEPSKKNPDPDYTAGALLARSAGEWWLIDVARIRATPLKTDQFLEHTADVDDARLPELLVPIRMEKEGGSSGKRTVDELSRGVFLGRDFKGIIPKGSKIERARPMSVTSEAGHFHLVEGHWNDEWLDEVEVFPDGDHDDQVDASSGAFAFLAKRFIELDEEAAGAIEQEDDWGAI
jgi:predicted phage terminase large subunit-like protein